MVNKKCEVCLSRAGMITPRCLHPDRPRDKMWIPTDGSSMEDCPREKGQAGTHVPTEAEQAGTHVPTGGKGDE